LPHEIYGLSKQEKSFRSLTGLSGEPWKALLTCFEEAHNEYLTNYNMDGKFRNGRGVVIFQPV
jgi:hypothetical protein